MHAIARVNDDWTIYTNLPALLAEEIQVNDIPDQGAQHGHKDGHHKPLNH